MVSDLKAASSLPKGWQSTTLGKVADFINGDRGKNYPGPLDRVDVGIPFINTGHIEPSGRLSHERMEFITREKFEKLGSGKVKPGDIVYCLRGSTIGKTARSEYEEGAIASSLTIVRAKPEVCQDYLYYFLISPNGQRLALEHDNGSAQPNLSVKVLSKYPLLLPPLSEQKAVAGFLGKLDEKTELNRQINTTLESMAQALFKSWFVDFDPVIDNALAAGNPIPDELQTRAERRGQFRESSGNTHPPLPADIQQLFPSSFVFTEEMGWVPEGWSERQLGAYLSILETGRRPKGGVAKYDSGVPSVGAESINGIGNFDFGKKKYIPEEFYESMKSGLVESYDVLLYKDGGKPGDFKPRIGMYGENFPFETFAINEHVFRLRSDELGQPFLYYQAGSQRSFHDLAVRGGKAAIPGVNQNDVKSLWLALPDKRLIEAFNKFSYPLFKSILKNANQSLYLQQVRDALLPKLLSGQIQIPEAEKQLAEVT